MTKEEVKALIKAKIEGQGSAIDAASVLPAILNGILDLIDGGGGGTSDAVQYIPQELTESQQMQARKNQGLYYKEGETVSSLIWDGVPSEDDIHVHVEEYGMDYYLHRASSVAIPPSQMLGATVSWIANTTEQSETITQGMVDTYESQAVSGAYNDGGAGFTVVLADSIEEPSLGITISRGVWFIGGSLDDDTSFFTKSIVLAEPYTEETISQIPSEYLEMEHLKLEFINRDDNGVSCSHTFSQAYHLLKTGCPILASYTAHDFGTSYSTEVYYDPENGINALFLTGYRANSVRYISMNLKEDDTVTVVRITFSATTQIEGGGGNA